jgi:pyruvate,water dikinase
MKIYILPLSDPRADLETVGGKGMSLAKLANAGLPVPGGFHITTEAYRQFVAANGLQPKILSALKEVDTSIPTTLETASAMIGQFFAQAAIPVEISDAIRVAYEGLRPRTEDGRLSLPVRGLPSTISVAVRSSATAEDLPDASFAGQQETYLNIRGEDALLVAVKKCWASLWTARAIAYRIKNNIDQKAVALAVVVQEMVNAGAAGILFTANPINGRRDEMVINTAWGLGEAIVGGLVSPDTVVADKATGKVKTMDVAEKTVITVLTESGTREEPLNDARRSLQVLKEAQVTELVTIAREIEGFYGKPQDIEWCYADGRFYIVQSRPITALAEAPIEWAPPDPKGTYMRTSAADLMPKPLSPLFRTMGIPAQVEQMQPLGKRLLGPEPVLATDYFTSVNSYAYMNAAISPRSWWWILTGMLPAYPRLLRRLVPIWREELHPEYQAFVASKKDLMPADMSAGELWHETQELANAAAYYICGLMFATMGASAGSEGLLTQIYNKMARQEGDPDAITLLMGWDNIPVRSEKSLYDLATWAQENDELARYLLETPTADLAAQISPLPVGRVPERVEGRGVRDFSEFASRFKAHLEKFGHIVFQLDYAEPLPRDHPEMLLENIKMYLRGEGSNPHERQQASEQKRIQTAETMLNRLKGFKRWAFTKALNWGQSMAEVREDALAEIGLAYPGMRELLRELGRRLVLAGAIQHADDIFWLEKVEISICVAKLERDQVLDNLAHLVEKRKAFNERVGQITPPPMMPMKKRVMGIKTDTFIAQTEESQSGNVLKGVATSVGKVTAPARVIHSPEDFNQMRPGDVLVAGATTPAWTPLFAMASAVVTDIGGPLSHGSIVAREYGIPAVMGTGIATRRIQSGQVITVDGAKGEVILETSAGDQTGQPAMPIEWTRPHPKAMYARASLAEHLPNAVSPLFGTLGLRAVNKATAELEDLMKINLVENEYQYRAINGYVYMGILLTARFTWAMTRLAFTGMKFMFRGGTERWLETRKTLASVIAKWDEKNLETLSPSEILAGARELIYMAGKYYTVIQAGTLPTASSSEIIFTRVYKMVCRVGDPKAETLLFGLETLPLRAEKSQFDLGMWVRERPALRDFTLHASRSTGELVTALGAVFPPEAIPAADWSEFKARFEKHLDEFGHSSYEFDFMNPTPAETPELILDAVKMYVEGKGSDPYVRQREVVETREQMVKKIHSRFKLIPNRWFDKALQWAMNAGPAREDSLADMGMGHTSIRRLLGELGKRFVANGALKHAEEIYWLVEDEVDELASLLERRENLPDHSSKAFARKAEWRVQMKLAPPPMLPATSRWAKLVPGGKGEVSGNVIKGLGASTGKVTATARLLFSPDDFGRMKQGDVLVAVTTTPAWTPLFTLASAVVTDIGGPLSHSSIVAREYDIPAVLATGVGTRHIRDGQTITVDGSAGTVTLL